MTNYLTIQILRSILRECDVNEPFTLASVAKASQNKRWVVGEVFEAFAKLGVAKQIDYSHALRAERWVINKPDFLDTNEGAILVGVQLGFKSASALMGFAMMPEMEFERLVNVMLGERLIATYMDGEVTKVPHFAVVVPLCNIYPVKIPTNLIKSTLCIDGKPKEVTYLNRTKELTL